MTGGFPQGRTMLITGDAGSGKTIFALQFARSSCLQNKKTFYISSEEDENDLHIQADNFGWDLKGLKKEGFLDFLELSELNAQLTETEINIGVESLKGNFAQIIQEIPSDVEVVVIDSLGSHSTKLTADEFRDRFALLIFELKKRGLTAMIVLESSTSKEFNEMALFTVYGALHLMKRENPYTGRRERVLDIVKMRSTDTPIEFIPYQIGSDGIFIYSYEEI